MQSQDQNAELNPGSILQIAFGFAAAKTLLSAVELNLFTELSPEPMDAATIGTKLGLHQRALRDFLDALVSLHLLDRDETGLYSNSAAADAFLDRNKPGYIGGMLEMANARLYGFWGSLTEALRTGQPQNEVKNNDGGLFDALYADPARLESFLKAMSALSLPAAEAIAAKFPWSRYRTFIDIGAAQGKLPVKIAEANPHLTGGGFDLPAVKPIFESFVSGKSLDGRLKFYEGDFFNEPLPTADVLIMGHILHDWNLDEKKMLLRKAYDALPENGALIVYEALIDDDRRTNTMGLLMSLNMLIETPGGFDYTGPDCVGWMTEAGFREARVEHLVGPDSMIIGIK